jgi:hypothetical protein
VSKHFGMVGAELGCRDGALVGGSVGKRVGTGVGARVLIGSALGPSDGCCVVGATVDNGILDGAVDGCLVVGATVLVGVLEGELEGRVAAMVGTDVEVPGDLLGRLDGGELLLAIFAGAAEG